MLTHFLLFRTIVVYELSAYTLWKNMDTGQTAPLGAEGSSLIRVHNVCFHDQVFFFKICS